MRPHYLVICLLAAVNASGRIPEEALAVIRTPNNGIPAIVLSGGTFDAVLSRKATLRLVGTETSGELTVTWSELPGGRLRAQCTLTPDTPAGMYAFEASVAGMRHRNPRAVYVVESFPEAYVFAHVTDIRIGAQRGAQSATDVFKAVVAAINASEAAFVLITGDLTEHGALEEFNAFLDVLDTCGKPTFVCAGERDRYGSLYEDIFAMDTYAFRFGTDGYLAFDTKEVLAADELGAQDGDLEVYRRTLRPCRWSVGFTHRYGESLTEPAMGIRSQLVLFVDDPLDWLIVGHWEREQGTVDVDKGLTVPWGTTKLLATPPGADGAYRLVDVTPRSVIPRQTQYAAPN